MKLRILPLITALCLALFTPTHAQESVQSVAEYAYITDFDSGRVLMDKNGDAPMKPASMAKIMNSLKC